MFLSTTKLEDLTNEDQRVRAQLIVIICVWSTSLAMGVLSLEISLISFRDFSKTSEKC